MSQYLAFISNHPFLAASAAALLGLIVAYELRNATRGYHDVDAADAPEDERPAVLSVATSKVLKEMSEDFRLAPPIRTPPKSETLSAL